MEFKGTKGKWKSKELAVMSDTNRQICGCYIMKFTHDLRGRYISDTEGKANALLISKSPELLEAVSELIKELEFHGYNHSTAINNARELIKQTTEL